MITEAQIRELAAQIELEFAPELEQLRCCDNSGPLVRTIAVQRLRASERIKALSDYQLALESAIKGHAVPLCYRGSPLIQAALAHRRAWEAQRKDGKKV